MKFHHHNRTQLSEMARQGYAVVVPLGTTEQHGPHLPVYTDSIICEHIVSQSVLKSSQSIPILMAPLLSIGSSDHHLSFGGTISLSSSTYLQMLTDVGESLVTCGFKKIIFLNGHGGNEPLMVQVANDLAVKHPIWTACASYWSIARTALQDIKKVGMVAGHAGGFETSLILAIQPDLVLKEHLENTTHIEREWIGSYPLGTFIGKHNELTGFDGYTDACNKATGEKGKEYIDAIVDSVSEWLVSIYRTMDSN